MRCSRAKKLIPFLASGELDESGRREIEGHLVQCKKCQPLAAEYAELARLARSISPSKEPPGFYDGFVQEVWQRMSYEPNATHKRPLARPAWSPFRSRYAIAGAGFLIAAIVVVILFNKMENQSQRTTLEAYLMQRDFRGLAKALTLPQQRTMLMHDSVSIGLLIESLELLHRMHARHGQVGQYVVQVVAAVQQEKQPDRNPFTPTIVRHASLLAGEFDFKEAVRAIQKLKRLGTKVTLRDLMGLWNRFL